MSNNQDLQSIQEARDLVERAYAAQQVLATFDQQKVDAICEAMSQAVLAQARRLAELAVQETTYGIVEDKIVKNTFAARDVQNFFRHLKTVGIIRETETLIEYASPRGVVAAICPSTNPTSTAIFKILISIKSRNSVVLSPHPAAAKCIAESARAMREAAVELGLPVDAIGCMSAPTVEGTEALMKHRKTAVILATGGIGLVRAAYSSGKPAFGVGPGNVPAYIEKTADVAKAVRDILTSKCFDNGTICASEQSLVVDAPLDAQARQELANQGAYLLSKDEAEKLGAIVLMPNRSLNPKIVGQSAQKIAQMAGIPVPPNAQALVAEEYGVGRDFPFSIEKLSPLLAYYVVNDVEEACKLCDQILHFGGMGHTAAIHSRDRNAIKRFGLLIPASRIVVNTPATHGAIGFSTELPPSMTLGCGSWGGNVTSDNVSPIHLMDIKRVAYEVREVIPERPGIAVPAFVPAPQQGRVAAAAPESPRIDRAKVAALVEKFITEKRRSGGAVPGAADPAVPPAPSATVAPAPAAAFSNGHHPVDFVCEDDVKRALKSKEKIYVGASTIITPSARELGEANEVFARS